MQLTSLLAHAGAVQAAAAAHGAHAAVDLHDYTLRLDHPLGRQAWQPKFVARIGQRLAYTTQPAPGTSGFAGWSPQGLVRWPVAADKDAFKRYAVAHGIRTPAACFDPSFIAGPFLVKAARSSFGEGQRGPFLAFDAADDGHRLADGEYYEQFVLGAIAKAWCWEGRCVALLLHSPTFVTGDGASSVRALVDRLPDSRGGPHDWPLVGRLARLCRVDSVDDVPPTGKDVLVEYRYGSRYDATVAASRNLAGEPAAGPLLAQFHAAAGALQATVPEGKRCLYTLDAVVDRGGTAWFLEMNCNPLVHPDAYAAMVASAFGTRTDAGPKGAAPAE